MTRCHTGVAAAVLAGLMTACGGPQPGTAPATVTPGATGCREGHSTRPAAHLVLPPANVPAGLSERSTTPVDLGGPSAAPEGESIETVYADNGNTRRLVTQAVVAADPSAAEALFDGARRAISTSGGDVRGAPHICDEAELAEVDKNGKHAFILCWHHANVFAELVEYHDLTADAVVMADVASLASAQDSVIAESLRG